MKLVSLPTTLPTLNSKNLILRSLYEHDIDCIFSIYGDLEVMRYASDDVFPTSDIVLKMLDSIRALLRSGTSLEWGIQRKNNTGIIGVCGVYKLNHHAQTVQVGCLLAKSEWGKTVMQEALSCVIDYCYTSLGIHQFEASIDEPNIRSIRLFERLGFVREEENSYILNLGPV
ncbi:GNAT family N-acetyltransferase [Pseudomonas protegens]|uniref:GNAT family N-acetyltransferase n=1 Tax=Pseudomonas protegens TaxID=380021 RepID=UPI000F4CB6D5|nr:GNAT family N-acetyltransferase [Pseudomonas protegens]